MMRVSMGMVMMVSMAFIARMRSFMGMTFMVRMTMFVIVSMATLMFPFPGQQQMRALNTATELLIDSYGKSRN
jgi:hypothetical protein